MQAWLEKYNAYEHQRWATQFERSIDRISLPLIVDESHNPFMLTPNVIAFWVHVTNQSQDVTDHIKDHVIRAIGCIPEGYNNIVCYLPSCKQWEMKFSCY